LGLFGITVDLLRIPTIARMYSDLIARSIPI
jgi:hypothetical protein